MRTNEEITRELTKYWFDDTALEFQFQIRKALNSKDTLITELREAIARARGTLGYGPLDTMNSTIKDVRDILDNAILLREALLKCEVAYCDAEGGYCPTFCPCCDAVHSKDKMNHKENCLLAKALLSSERRHKGEGK
jgi:hypothetical protein